jgi:hypothetical protein
MLSRYMNLLRFGSIGVGGSILKLALLGLVAAVQIGNPNLLGQALHAQDPRVGSWTLVSAQSSLDPPNKLAIASLKDGVHVTMTGESRMDFTAKWSGHDNAVPANPGFNQVDLKRIDKKQVEVTEKKDGSVVAKIRNKISNDGNELTLTTVSQGHPDQITVWTRTGGTKVARDPFAGDWTQDLGKTRLRQGLSLKIESTGDGVRFSGGYSYTARFDGKQYDVKNSRNDTVALALADAHTVDATYRRDTQVTQKERWVVSADGKQMTLTSTGALETGQRVSEKLTFQKQ